MQTPDVISYQEFRKLVGFLALAFLLALVIGAVLRCPVSGVELQSSISGYYYTAMRDVFVGTLCVVVFFIFFYWGYHDNPWDAVAAKAAYVFVLGVAGFLTKVEAPYPACTIRPGTTIPSWVGTIHYAFAASLFATLAVFSLVLFTKSKGRMTAAKKPQDDLPGVRRGDVPVHGADSALPRLLRPDPVVGIQARILAGSHRPVGLWRVVAYQG